MAKQMQETVPGEYTMRDLYKELLEYGKGRDYPFHMPGHKRQASGYPMEAFYNVDITEIPGFDDLHHPEDILMEISEGFRAVYDDCETFLMVNGSTGGILSAISAALEPEKTLLMARNCHQSVYNAAAITGCKTSYVYPLMDICGGKPFIPGKIDPADIEAELNKNNNIGAVVITSPTYHGVVSDIRSISGICHNKNVPLIVDAAHGAHFALDERFPESATGGGADIVIHSLHKTLPSLTQTALLHVGGDIIDRERLKYFLSVYQSSSPSYILMASMGECLRIIKEDGRALCDTFFEYNRAFEEKAASLKGIRLYNDHSVIADPCKKIIYAGGNGIGLYNVLKDKYGLVCEMSEPSHVTMIATIMDSKEGWERLWDALYGISLEHELLPGKPDKEPFNTFDVENKPEIVYTIKNAMRKEWELLDVFEAEGAVSAGFVRVYPPGIPFIIPGEKITSDIIMTLDRCNKEGYNLQGVENGKIRCIRG